MQVRNTLRQSFSPLRILNFRMYFGGQAISLTGTWLQATAQSLLVYQLSSGSSSALGIVAMLNTLPLVLLSPLASTLADRLDRRKTLIATQTGEMLLALILAVLVQSKAAQLWHVYVLTALLGAINAPDLPSAQAFTTELTGIGEVRKAVNLNTMVIQACRMIGPALAGYLIGLLGIASAFWLNGLSFLFVIASLIVVRTAQGAASQRTNADGGFGEALRFIRGQPRIQDLIALVVLLVFLGAPFFILIPVLVKGAPEQTGLLLDAAGLGALTSVILVVPLAQSVRRVGFMMVGSMAWVGLWFIAIAWAHTSVPLMAVGIFMSSVGQAVVPTTAMGLLQVLALPTMRARLSSIFLVFILGFQPVAALLIGYCADWLGATTVIAMNGIALMAGASLMLALQPGLRRWEIAPQAAGEKDAGRALELINAANAQSEAERVSGVTHG